MQTKDTLPMDIEFMIQDTFALTRPSWKIITNLEEAGRAFGLLLAQESKVQDADNTAEADGADDEPVSDGDGDDDDLHEPEIVVNNSSSDEAEAEVELATSSIMIQADLFVSRPTTRKSSLILILRRRSS